ncbi:hypothetical protein R70006_06231 [Paraburkholderia domus]|uniref:hypothetical protein n=1 Tax=Paraburkholderia domus TaxID=2793075 RepID=UPI001913E4D7|nr:hypothetical protein [Paraburkholderia domus]MBK5052862.1 hypothetical protein [Burkholderia sp. R-70006]CAE6821680.1 hypothetical protein R70006_06231 [Paraburkholderia domus]
MPNEVFLEGGFSGVRPTPQATVEAFLTACYPGSRRVGDAEDPQIEGYALRQAFTTSTGERMNVYLKQAQHGGWKVAAKSRVCEEPATTTG